MANNLKPTLPDQKKDSTRFLKELFLEEPGNSKILIWELTTKKSRWFSTINKAAEFAAGKSDVYVGCALSPKSFGPSGRCHARDTVSISGFWMDIDYKHSVHKKSKLPPSIKSAIKLATCIIKPTVIISTGHGIQAWWLFKEPWVFENEKDRELAARYLYLWEAAIRRQAEKKNYEIDATAELARIFRIPGTYNAKGAKKIPVTFIEDQVDFKNDFSRRLCYTDFEQYFPEEQKFNFEKKEQKIKNLSFNKKGLPKVTIRPQRGPNPEKWFALKSLDPRVEATFEHKRKDLADTSPSGYDMSLANFASQAEWSDQEICDLLVAHRIRHNPNDPKLKRPDYFAMTIARATQSRKREQAQSRIEDIVDFDMAEGVDNEDEEGKKAALVKDLAETLEVPITKIVRYLTDPPVFRLETKTMHINLGTVDNLIEQRKFKNAVAAITGLLIAPIDSKRWPKTAQALLRACYDMDAGMESTDKGSVLLWLNRYFEEQKPMGDGDDEERKEAIGARFPFFWQYRNTKKVCIFLSDFKTWLRNSEAERLTGRQLGILLRGFGGENKPVKSDGKAHWVWVFDWKQLKDKLQKAMELKQ